MSAPGKVNLAIYQGATYDKTFTWIVSDVPVNLTGYTARMKVRPTVSSSTVYLDLTTANGKIVLGGSAGTVQLLLSATETAALTFTTGVYDLELVSGSTVTRLIEGNVTVSKEVTR